MREIRPYGSARGVRSNPYPYRDHILPMRSMAKKLNPATRSRENHNLTLTVPESPH